MKIYSIKTNISSRTYNNNNRLKFQPKYQSPITFNGSDTYQGSSFIDKQINDLKNNIETKISPLKDKYKQEFLQVGLIGYDSQEKLKLIRKYETALMNKKLQTPENTDLISATKNNIGGIIWNPLTRHGKSYAITVKLRLQMLPTKHGLAELFPKISISKKAKQFCWFQMIFIAKPS